MVSVKHSAFRYFRRKKCQDKSFWRKNTHKCIQILQIMDIWHALTAFISKFILNLDSYDLFTEPLQSWKNITIIHHLLVFVLSKWHSWQCILGIGTFNPHKKLQKLLKLFPDVVSVKYNSTLLSLITEDKRHPYMDQFKKRKTSFEDQSNRNPCIN